MAVNTALFWFSLVLSVIGSNAVGELSILHSPSSLKFSGSSKTPETLLKEIFSASLGLSVEENSKWDGLYISDPFKTPEAVVEVYIDGVSSLGDAAGLKWKKYPVTVDEYEPDTFDAVKHRIEQRFTNGHNKIININLSAPELSKSKAVQVFGSEINVPKVSKQTLNHLKYAVEEDYQFLKELETLKAITNMVKSSDFRPDDVVDFYSFRLQSLHALSDIHGPNSLPTKEAKKLLGEALQKLNDAFVKAYDGSVLVTAVSTDVEHTRRIPRSVSLTDDAGSAESDTGSGTEAEDGYSGDYPAIFNIILWFGVVFSFTLIAIVYTIMDMDPGRDSIIYRMTSTRMKKDN